ncbi:MAG: hypothetical protein IKS90_04400 [Clostridia bacterium]|nr:hypothetical protein [Clostridia bacterium]
MKSNRPMKAVLTAALILAALFACACRGCSETPSDQTVVNGVAAPTASPTPMPTPEPTPVPDRLLILGDWKTSSDILPAVEAYMEGLGMDISSASAAERAMLDIAFTFNEDGKLTYSVDRASANKALETLAPRLAPVFKNSVLESLGPILSKLGDKAILAMLDYPSWEELAKATLIEVMEPMLEGAGRYALYDGRLIMSLDIGEERGNRLTLEYALSAREMTLCGAQSADDTVELPERMFPLTLVKTGGGVV